MTRIGHRFGEVAILDRLRGLGDRGLDQSFAASGSAVVHAGQFHDAEQLIA